MPCSIERSIRNPEELAAAKYDCQKWLEAGGLGLVNSFKVAGAELNKAAAPPVVSVYVTVNDKLKKIDVLDGESLKWGAKE